MEIKLSGLVTERCITSLTLDRRCADIPVGGEFRVQPEKEALKLLVWSNDSNPHIPASSCPVSSNVFLPPPDVFGPELTCSSKEKYCKITKNINTVIFYNRDSTSFLCSGLVLVLKAQCVTFSTS